MVALLQYAIPTYEMVTLTAINLGKFGGNHKATPAKQSFKYLSLSKPMRQRASGLLTMTLWEIAKKIYAKLDTQSKMRDHLLEEVRKVLNATREAIAAIHRNEAKNAERAVKRARDILSNVRSKLASVPALPVTGLIHNAEGEVTEAMLLLAFWRHEDLPTPEQIGVSEIGYLLGLGDLVGELRRVAVDSLKEDNLDLAIRAFTLMEEIYSMLLIFDFPRAMTPGIRQKADVARGLVERTRADISTEVQRRRLIASIKDLQEILKRAKA